MATSMTKQQTGVGISGWVLINLNAFNEGVGLIAVVTGGTCTYSLEVTGQDPKLSNFGTLVNGMDNMTALTTSKNGSLQFPCTAIRINIASVQSGAPTVSLSVVQSVD